MYSREYDEGWPKYFKKLDNSIKERIVKKIQKILVHPKKKHMKKGARFFDDEVGQYRITYRAFEENKIVRFYFVGDHKDYKKWYKRFF